MGASARYLPALLRVAGAAESPCQRVIPPGPGERDTRDGRAAEGVTKGGPPARCEACGAKENGDTRSENGFAVQRPVLEARRRGVQPCCSPARSVLAAGDLAEKVEASGRDLAPAVTVQRQKHIKHRHRCAAAAARDIFQVLPNQGTARCSPDLAVDALHGMVLRGNVSLIGARQLCPLLPLAFVIV